MPESITYQERVTVGGVTDTYTRSLSQDSLTEISASIPQNSTDLEIALNIDVSEVEFFLIVADVAMTIQTNDGTTPDNTLTLVADQPYIWSAGMLHAFALTVDVTSIFVTTGAVGTGSLTIQVLQDPTP